MGDLGADVWQWITDNAVPLGVVVPVLLGIGGAFYSNKREKTPSDSVTINNNGLTLKDALALVEAQVAHWRELTREQEQTIHEQERQLGVNQGAFQSFFAILDENNVPQEQWPARLVAIADRHMALRKQVQSIPGNDGRIPELKQKVEAAIAAVHHDEADALLAQVLELQGVEMAATWGSRGELAMTRLRYADAAGHFASAANALPPTQEAGKLAYLGREADAWVHQGEEFGDNDALEKSIELYKKLLEAYPRDRAPDDWAAIQNNLGIALRGLGERESGTTRLEEALQAYREALEERTQARVPLDWAAIQNNLGNVLVNLGERKNCTCHLEKAVHAYLEALKERTQACVPLDWAATKNNLGNALVSLGERQNCTCRLEEAVQVYREALKERIQARVPLDWAMTQNNLGTVLSRLGERENGMTRLEEAVQVYREALKERTQARVPLDWAMTQNNLGTVLFSLGEREGGTARLEEAMVVVQNALRVAQERGASYYIQGMESNLQKIRALLAVRKGKS
ncbi:MAG: tetratricopeptide repeat protein [Magnetococcales bacterium]|nr:tetratricopeptide repeat protein [Magnetococcales bacterium]